MSNIRMTKSTVHIPESIENPMFVVDDGTDMYYQCRTYRTFVHDGPNARRDDAALREQLANAAWQPGYLEDIITS